MNQSAPASLQWREILPKTVLWLAVWTVIAVISATIVYVGSGASDLAVWVRGFRAFLAYWYIWAVVLLLIHRINRRSVPRVSSLIAKWPYHLLLFSFVSIVTAFSTGASWRYYLYGEGAAFFHGMNVPVYLLLATGSAAWLLYLASIDREREAAALMLRTAKLESQLTRARMDTLRAQIHPHVLFNALNSIAALIRTGRTDECYRMTELLASLLRSLLDESAKDSVLLDAELEFVARYLELESIRFRDRLTWTIDAADDSRFVHVPPFLLQPMVENVIKHAVEATPKPIQLGIQARNDGTRLYLSISDDGPGLDAAAKSDSGVGIRNVRERLELIYGADSSLDVVTNNGVTVQIAVPLEFPRASDPEAA